MSEADERPRIRRISVDEVEVGMYCEDVYNEQGVLILSAHIPIANPEQINVLKRLGVKNVDINTAKGKDAPSAALPAEAARAIGKKEEQPIALVPLEEEIPKAREIYGKTLLAARNALKAIKIGQAFPAEEIESVVEEIVESIFRNPDALVSLSQIRGYDEYTYEHSVNVSMLVCSLSHALGYEKDMLMEAGVGGLLHDIGKTWIPEHIVNKPGKFTEAEYSVMKHHPEYGYEIVKDRKGINDVSKRVIIQHHERINGKGYPKGLKGNQIHYMGIIAGLADVYDAMTSNRIYRPAFTPQHALATIYSSINADFPRKIAEQFIKLLGVFPVGSFVRLVSGEMGIVTKINRKEILSPDIMVLFSDDGEKLPAPVEYQLSEKIRDRDGGRYAIDKSLNPASYGIEVSEFIKGKISV